MKETKNYKLKLPEQTDNIDIDVLDGNFTKIDDELQKTNKSISDHTKDKTNPHNVTAEQLGLGKVENKSSAEIRNEITKQNVMNALGTSPSFTSPTAVTPSKGDNSQRLAATAFVAQAIESLKALLGADYISNVIKSVDIEIVRKVNWGHSEYPYYTVECIGCTLLSGEYISNSNGTLTKYGSGYPNVQLPFYIGIDTNKTVLTPVSEATLNSGIITIDASLPSTYSSIRIESSTAFTDCSNEYSDDYAEYAICNATIPLR